MRGQQGKTRRDRFPHQHAFGIAREGQRTDPFGDMERRPPAILSLDRERAGPDMSFEREDAPATGLARPLSVSVRYHRKRCSAMAFLL